MNITSTVHGTTVNLTNDWFRFETWRSMEDILESTYREEKSLHHVAMLANFVDNNKPKTSLKK